MREPGDLIHAGDYAIAFRRLEPLPDPADALLVLLHGVGGNESQLQRLGQLAPPGTIVVLARGFRAISGDRWGWYRVGFGEQGPQVVVEEMHEARGKLVEFIGQLQRHHDIAPARTVVAGFSQGGIVAACVALTVPASIGAFAMIAGRLLPEVEPITASTHELAHLRALVVHGRADATLPVAHAEAAGDRLRDLGLAHEVRLHAGGHELTPAIGQEVARWLATVLDEGAGSGRASVGRMGRSRP